METFEQFLLNAGPNQPVVLDDAGTSVSTSNGSRLDISIPVRLELHCARCGGQRGFEAQSKEIEVWEKYRTDKFISYKCKDCEKESRTFAIRVQSLGGRQARLTKFGEYPPFGPEYDPAVGALLGDDDHLYRKGLDCESAGMGIGAFAYYRRLIDNQRFALFDRVIRVAEKLNAAPDLLEGLRKARADRQFTKAIESIKAGPLQAIYINGHNPLTLLYDAISDGLHAQSDQENLDFAKTIRLLLADLAMRLNQALADHKDVEDAVNRLLKAQSARKDKQKED